ncbi:MAG: hypothetical protein K6G48_07210 [Acholeplasmatales bacterium]|nr:hypothetical protein [Acholeplasmatales bacterium]
MKKTQVLTLSMLGLASVVALGSCGSSKTGYADMPSIDYIFNTNSGHQAIAENIQATYKNYGIKMNLSQDTWNNFLTTRKQGNYTAARNGWLADYNDPISFLDMWITDSGNNDCQLGRGDAANYTYEIDLSSIDGYEKLSGTWAQTYDVLIGYIKAESNTTKRYKLMHKAETLLMSTGVISPIYNYVDNWLQNSNLTDVYASPLGYKYFQWAENNTGKDLTACLASTPTYVDPALNSAVDGASYAVHLFGGLVRYVPTADGTGLELAPDLATSLPEPVIGTDGKATYTFTIRSDAKFSDGTAITAQDFVDSWNRAASYSVGNVTGLDADYGYMFEVIDGYDSLSETSAAGAERSFLNVTATSDDTLQVVTTMEYPYFYELCAFPAYTVLKDAWNLGTDGAWAIKSSAVTSGAYKIKSFTKDTSLVIEQNTNYWDSANVKNATVTFPFNDDDSSMLGSYMNQSYLLIDSMSKETVATYKTSDEYHVMGQLGTYYVSWNINADMFDGLTQAEAEEVRYALSLLIDRKYITESVTGLGETPSTGFVGAGLSDPAGGEFVDHNGAAEDGSGWTGNAEDYASNVVTARTILDKYYKYY